jgi:hypothetical protein
MPEDYQGLGLERLQLDPSWHQAMGADFLAEAADYLRNPGLWGLDSFQAMVEAEEQNAAAFAVVFAVAFASDFVDASSFDQVRQDCLDLKGFAGFVDLTSADYWGR